MGNSPSKEGSWSLAVVSRRSSLPVTMRRRRQVVFPRAYNVAVPLGFSAIPQARDRGRFFAEPFAFLAETRREAGNLFALPGGAVFSRAKDVNGVVCAFGEEFQREILTQMDSYAMPESAARIWALPETLVNLNRGLHSLTGLEHNGQKKLLAQAIPVVPAGGFLDQGWEHGASFGVLAEMRGRMLDQAGRAMFGSEYGPRLGKLVNAFFQFRREATAPGQAANQATADALTAQGEAVDNALREYVRNHQARDGALAGVARLARDGGALTEDQAVGHLNVLFISSTEPLAVALAWTILLLSQLPGLRSALRREAEGAPEPEAMPLLHTVVQESLRLLPPNAFMVRLTSRPARLGPFALPERCEVILSPFVSHRDATVFGDPNGFRPERWSSETPSPFVYFPFGAGGHGCVGKTLAMRLLKGALAQMARRYDLVLQGDQEVDWRLQVQFLPAPDPVVTAYRAERREGAVGGRLGGPVGRLIDF